MSNETISKAIIYFIIGARIYDKEIKKGTKEYISQEKEDEFWGNINKFSEPILHILKGVDTEQYGSINRSNTSAENVKIYLGNLKKNGY